MRLDKAQVARATVRFVTQGKQGVIVPCGLIVTAAHVITWEGTGSMALGDNYIEDIRVGDRKIRAQVYAAEPVSDIAVLGAPDDQGPLAEAYETCIESLDPLEEAFALQREGTRVAVGVTVPQVRCESGSMASSEIALLET